RCRPAGASGSAPPRSPGGRPGPCRRPRSRLPPSATSDREYHFHPIALAEPVLGVATARDDFAVDLDRHPAPRDPLLLQQLLHREGVVHDPVLAVVENAHRQRLHPSGGPILGTNAGRIHSGRAATPAPARGSAPAT